MVRLTYSTLGNIAIYLICHAKNGQRELLVRLKVNFYGWLHNLMSLREIIDKRRNRTAKPLAIE